MSGGRRDPIGIVLVHGGFHGPWCWDKLVPRLRADDVAIATPDTYEGPTPADPGVVQAAVDRFAEDGPVLVCAHSAGGFAVTALDPSNVARMVYLCAFLPDDHEWFPDLPVCPGFFDMVATDVAGVMTTKPDRARELFYGDCSDEDAAWAIRQLRWYSMDGASTVMDRPAWREVPSTYVQCSKDNVLTQEYMSAAAARMGRGVCIPTSHSPMISRPDLVAHLLNSVAGELRV